MKLRAWAVLGLAVVSAGVAGALCPPAIWIRTLVPMGTGVTENPDGDGMAKVQYYVDAVDGPSVRVYVHLHRFKPLCTYSVFVATDQGERDLANVVVTNIWGNGNALFHFPVAAEPDAAAVLVYRDLIANGTYDVDDPETPGNEDEIRAFGIEEP